MRGEKVCMICGKHYVYCPNCGNGDPKETWRNLYCSDNCRTAFDVLSKWKNNAIATPDAKKILEELKVDSMQLNEMLKADVDAIMATNATANTSEAPSIIPKKRKFK